MGRHSKSDLQHAAPEAAAGAAAPAGAGRSAGRGAGRGDGPPGDERHATTGDPTWEHWWEKTGGQPAIVDPVAPDPARPGPAGGRPPDPRFGSPRGPARPSRPAEPAGHPASGHPAYGPGAAARPGSPPAADPRPSGYPPGRPVAGAAQPPHGPADDDHPRGLLVGGSAALSHPGLVPLAGSPPILPRPGLPPAALPPPGVPARPAALARPGSALPGQALPGQAPAGLAAPSQPNTGPLAHPGTGPVSSQSAAFPVLPPGDDRPDATMTAGRALRAVPGADGPAGRPDGPSGRGAPAPWAARRPTPGPAAGAAAAAAMALPAPAPYDTGPQSGPYQPLAGADAPGADRSRFDRPGFDGPGSDRSRFGRPGFEGPGFNASGVAGPGFDGPGFDGPDFAGPGVDDAGFDDYDEPPEPRRRRGRRRADASAASPAASPAGRGAPVRAVPDRDEPAPGRGRRADPPAWGDRDGARPLRAVDSEPGRDSADTGVDDGFEDEPALILQWGFFVLQTILGAAGGLGAWLGFHVLWDRWPFYAAAAVGAAVALMLVIARALRRRYGHDLDLLTALIVVGIGVVLTVLPAAFALQNR
jgi:hypothetical protein